MKFVSPTKGTMSLEEVLNDIEQYINEDNEMRYSLIVGTDSQRHGRSHVFVTSIIIHRIGKGARYFYRKEHSIGKISIAEKIYQEVANSLEIANQISKTDIMAMIDNFQVHIDVGRNGKTKDLIAGATGMVVGSGFDAQIKPYSFGASSVCDRLSK